MVGGLAARGLTSLGLICASLAWTGYVFLHTVGDPTRAEDVATAVLDDEASREQLASSFALQIVRATGVDRSSIDVVETAVAQALTDPRITTDLISAFGSSHSNALGVEDPRSTTISPDAVLAAVSDQVAVVSPEIAGQISAQLPEDVLPEITLPTFHPPGIGTARTVADAATGFLALAAAALVVLAFALGERRRVLRRAGLWAVVAGVAWVVIPIAIVAGARAWASDADAIVETAVRASVDGVTPVAIAMLIAGAVAIVLSLVPALWPDRPASAERGAMPHRATAGAGGASGYGAASGSGYPSGHTTGHPAAGRAAPVAAPTDTPVTARVDTYVPGAGATARPAASAPPVTAPPAAAPHVTAPRSAGPATPVPPADDVDPWAAYFGPDRPG